MNDIEQSVFNDLSVKLRNEFDSIIVYNYTVLTPSEFPCACIEESDNYTHTQTLDSSGKENHVNTVFDVNIYSNKVNGTKKECKNILSIIDNYFITKGFERTTRTFVPMSDATKGRLFARYRAVVGSNNLIYRR